MIATRFTELIAGTPEAELVEQIAAEVALVEQELFEQVGSPVALVEGVLRHTLSAGGKRLRPAFVSLAARAVGSEFDPARARILGACMEMIHMATLIHDDVIDNAATRRGRETASAAFGNTAAILSGDVLLSKAMALLARDGDLEIIRKVSDAVVQMSEGEVRELELRGVFDVSEDAHLEVLRMKTAAFIQCCCDVGALIAGASDEKREALGAYGHHVGMAFQIADDLLDYRVSQERTGKPRATDFREGCATLPLIYLAPLLSDTELDSARRGFGNGVEDPDLDQLLRLMDLRGAYDRAEERAREHVRLAVEAADALEASPAREVLCGVAEFVVRRDA